MFTLQELRSRLDDVDLRTRVARAAQRYLASKGYPDVRPLGVLEVDGAAYFYYALSSEGSPYVLELEVRQPVKDELGREFVCRVTAWKPLSREDEAVTDARPDRYPIVRT